MEQDEEMAEEEDEDVKRAKVVLADLIDTIRGSPFCQQAHLGKASLFGGRFHKDEEYFYRLNKLKSFQGDESVNLRELFIEAAIDFPDKFPENLTHYNTKTRKLEECDGREREDLDRLFEYVNTIKKEMDVHYKRSWNYPHAKWLEFRKRIDKANMDRMNRWRPIEIFTELAATGETFRDAPRGFHYNEMLGLQLKDADELE